MDLTSDIKSNITNLSDLQQRELLYAYDYEGSGLFTPMYEAYNHSYYEGVISAMNQRLDFNQFTNTKFYEQYMLNTFQFSAAKSIAEMRMLQQNVFDEKGIKRSFEDFKTLCRPVQDKFAQWQRVEYDMASRGSIMAEKWKSFKKDSDVFPYFKYITRHDDKVRDHHKDLHGKIFTINDAMSANFYPPNGWNCRCSAENTDEGTPLTDTEMDNMKKHVDPEFFSNVGEDGIFPKTKTYFEILKNANKANNSTFNL